MQSRSSCWVTPLWGNQSKLSGRDRDGPSRPLRSLALALAPGSPGLWSTCIYGYRLVERFLLDNYKPHQLSTYALTLYRYNFKTQDAKTVACGEWLSNPALRGPVKMGAAAGARV